MIDHTLERIMGRLRKHLQNKTSDAAKPDSDNASTTSGPKSPRGSRLRARRNSSASEDASPKKVAPKVRRRSGSEAGSGSAVENSSESTASKTSPVQSVADSSVVNTNDSVVHNQEAPAESTFEDSTPKPRIHAAPPRIRKAEPVQQEKVSADIPKVSDATTAPERTVETKSSVEQHAVVESIPEVSDVIDASVAVEETAKSAESATTKGKRPTVHAAPPEAYLRAQRAIAQNTLGSAVVTPPPVRTEADNAEGGKGSKSKWEAEEEARKEKLKSTKSKRSGKRRSRNWSSMASTDSESPSTPYNNRRRNNRRKKGVAKPSPKAKAIKRRVMIDGSITVADLAHAISQKSGALIKTLIGFGEMATINDTLDFDTASTVAAEYEYEAIDTSFQENEFLITEETKQDGELRAPVVTIMGHVDHGKTTLLDTIRKANVAGGEAGGITQHTSAYQVSHNDQLVTFIDTPGHEAFTAMRARGAQVTDIVILVVAADDGPMPQTIEALNHARASGVQLMVAVNKCDKPGADPAKVRQDMMRYELVSEEYGGDTIFVNVSALKGEGIDELLENITLLSEMGEYRAPVNHHAEGFVLEARLEKGRGAVATLLVKSGTLKKGDTLVLGNVWGRVRAMYDYKGKVIKSALPSTPVELIGLQDIPAAGDDFVVVKKPKDAKALVAHRAEEARTKAQLAASNSVSLEELLRRQVEGEPVKLNLIIKSDVGGTLEAMKGSIGQIDVPGTEINVLHAAIGGITESDVSLAHTYDGIIIGFNVRPDAKARKVVNQTNVEVRTYSVIYEALEDLEKGLKGLLEPEIKEQWKGSAEIKETFNVPKVGTVAGCFVLDGSIARKHKIRLLRDGTIMWEGKLASLRRFKDDVREVEKGYECGMNLDGFNDIKVGDQLESFMMEEQEVE